MPLRQSKLSSPKIEALVKGGELSAPEFALYAKRFHAFFSARPVAEVYEEEHVYRYYTQQLMRARNGYTEDFNAIYEAYKSRNTEESGVALVRKWIQLQLKLNEPSKEVAYAAFESLKFDHLLDRAGYTFPRDFRAAAARCVDQPESLEIFLDYHVGGFLLRVVAGANAANKSAKPSTFTERWKSRSSGLMRG